MLNVRPGSPVEPVSVQVLSVEFNRIVAALDEWAAANQFAKEECATSQPTPLCKRYKAGRIEFTASLETMLNHTRIFIQDFSGGSRLGETERSLISALGSKGWVVRNRHDDK